MWKYEKIFNGNNYVHNNKKKFGEILFKKEKKI